MSATAFQRKRRNAKLKALEEVTNLEDKPSEAVEAVGVVDEKKSSIFEGVTVDVVEVLSIEKVRELLDKAGIEYVHNTGEKKLKAKLREAIRNGVNR